MRERSRSRDRNDAGGGDRGHAGLDQGGYGGAASVGGGPGPGETPKLFVGNLSYEVQ